MRWRQGRRSTNVEDRRGGRGGRRGVKVGGGMVVLALLAALLLGEDPGQVLDLLGGDGQASLQQPAPPANDAEADFVSVVLADTEDTWSALFASYGERYQPPRLVLYDDVVQSACGLGEAATGPFYCPGDHRVYLDLGFFRTLQRLGAPGDFAVAYVIAHEIGHHVQNLVGTEAEVRRLQSRASRAQANALSVKMELQADCYAGLWARHANDARRILEEGDIEEGLGAAAAVGDDRLQQMAGGRVQPDAFTHGTSQQRVQWFRTGLQQGSLEACDTFR